MVNACIRAHAQTDAAAAGAAARGDHRRRARPASSWRPSCTARPARWSRYGLDRVDADKDIQVNLIEAADRDPAGAAAAPVEGDRGAAARARRRGAHRTPRWRRCCRTACGSPTAACLPAELVVWAAGVKAADFLKDIARPGDQPHQPARGAADAADDARRRHLRHRRLRRLRVAAGQRRQGRPGAAARAGGAPAGIAHGGADQARACAASRCKPYRYRDFGSLVSLGEFSTVGNMMGGLIGGSLMIEGLFARLMYVSLYKMHELRPARRSSRSRSTRWRG